MPAGNGEDGYLIWRRYAELGGDKAMAARLHVVQQARQAGCRMTVELPDGREMRIPEMIAAEAAVGALEVRDEEQWHRQWTRRLVDVAVKWQDDATTAGVVAALNHTDAIIAELKAAGVWPWGSDQTSEE